MHLQAFLLLLGVTAISCSTTTTTTTAPSSTTTTTAATPTATEEEPVLEYTPCRYWCIYKRPYCCDDGSLTVPRDHLPHTYLDCPPIDQQICKTTGIFLNNTAPAMVLAKGDPKKQVWCASDGYCEENERCCPSHCVRRHLCMAGLKQKEVVLDEEEYLPGDEMEVEEEDYLPVE